MRRRAYLWAFVIAAFASWSLKGMAMSVRWDPGVSKPVRDAFAAAERSMGFGGGGDATMGQPYGYRGLPGLAKGWIAGRRNDLSDDQWRTFRDNLPLLAAAAVATSALSRAMRRVARGARDAGKILIPFHVVYGAAFAFFLHGFGALWPAGLCLAHYALCRAAAGWPKIGPILVWGFAIAALARVQFGAHQWTLASLADAASPMLSRAARQRIAALDAPRHRGLLPRWWIHYNLLTLRMISFGMDLHWRRLAGDDLNDDADPPGDHAALVSRPRREVRYSLGEYLAYVTYPPLYLAGPTCTFNAFASQLRRPLGLDRCASLRARSVARYAVAKFAGVLLILEVWTHTIYANAMCKSRVWQWGGGGRGEYGAYGPFEVGVLSLMVLNFMWLKFTVVWRFFRLWALASGVDVPENMLRCINNNATILGFWKGWHASYNRWLVRYIYVPLGGARYRLLNVWAVFGFVGAWHDKVAWHLIHWAWIFALFLAPEIAVRAVGAKYYQTPEARSKLTYKLARAACGGAMIHVLIAGNMVGYVVGADGLSQLGRLYADDVGSALRFFAMTMAMMSAAAHLGFEQRAREDAAREGAGKGAADTAGGDTAGGGGDAGSGGGERDAVGAGGRRRAAGGGGGAEDAAPVGDSKAGDGGRRGR